MKQQHLAGAFALVLLAAGTAFAAGPTNAEYYPFQEAASVTTPTDKTGSVSRSDSTEINTTKMGAQGNGVSEDQSRQILMYLKAGA